jgi:MobA-like NTP transferase domain
MRVVIMAAGDGLRWKNYLGAPKHLAPVDGIPLLHRTITLLHKAGIEDIHVTVREPGALGRIEGAHEYHPTDSEYEIDRIWGARALVDGTATFIYGDAYYTAEAIQTITTNADEFHFFGRSKPSRSKPFGKIFGIRVNDFVLSNVKQARDLYREGKLCRCIGWEVYGLCTNTPRLGAGKKYFFSEKDDTSAHFTEITDRTEDFNEPFELERWIDCWTNLAT